MSPMNFSVRRAADIDPGPAGGPTDNPARTASPQLRTGHATLDRAFRIALGDFLGNIQPWAGDPAEHVAPCILLAVLPRVGHGWRIGGE